MSLEEPTLKTTNVLQPHLHNSSSKQSITGSEDFHSLEGSIHNEENMEDETPRQTLLVAPPTHQDHSSSINLNDFVTPPSRIHTPPPLETSQNDVSPLQYVSHPLGSHPAVRRKPVASSVAPITVRPVSPVETEATATSPGDQQRNFLGDDLRGHKMEDQIRREMTPGQDNSPIIHFALDQLTRDVEVRGSRVYPEQSPTLPQAAVFKQHRGSHPSTRQSSFLLPTIQSHSSPIPPATAALGATVLLQGKRLSAERSRESFPAPRPIPRATVAAKYAPEDKEIRVSTPPQAHPASSGELTPSPPSNYDVFVPYEPLGIDYEYPPLTYLPCPLRPASLGIFLWLNLVFVTLLIFTAVWSKKHDGLTSYGQFGDGKYFLFQYLPQMIGLVILMWLFQIQTCLTRVAPFIAMASQNTVSRSKASLLPLYPVQFFFPQIQYFQTQQIMLGVFAVVSWICLFTVPLLAAGFNVRYVTGDSGSNWRWLAVQGVIWTIVALYLILIIAIIGLIVYLQRIYTGLKWDPRSIADIMAMIGKANISSDYADSEIFANKTQFKQRLWTRTDRLGYWHTTRNSHHVFYGLGEEGGATRRYSLEHGRMKPIPNRRPASRGTHHTQGTHQSSVHPVTPDSIDANWPGDQNFNYHPEILEQYVPWQLSSTARLAYAIVAVVLLVAFFVISFLHQASANGFIPRLQASADANGFSSTNFLYSFLPCFLGMVALLLWQPLDYTHRYLAPWKALNSRRGASPKDSLLLDLPFTLPLLTTLKALQSGNIVVAATSFFSLTATVLPILGGGVFWAQYYPNSEVRVAAESKGYYALCAFLVIYALGYVFLLVLGRPVALPHGANSLAEVLSWLYMSPIINDRHFIGPASKKELAERLDAPISGVVVPPEVTARRKWKEMNLGNMFKSGGKKAAARPKNALTKLPSEARGEKHGSHTSSPPRLTVRLIGEEGYSSEIEGEQDHNVPIRGADSLDDFFAPILGSSRDQQAATEEEASLNYVAPEPYNPTQPITKEEYSEKRRTLVPPKYGFGVFLARDGKERLGVERVVRGGREMQMAARLSKKNEKRFF